MLLSAETDRDGTKAYVTRYYDAALRAAVLQEKLSADETNEMMLTIGVAVGGAVIGLAPVFWDKGPIGVIALILGGLLLMAGSYLGRRRFKKAMKKSNSEKAT